MSIDAESTLDRDGRVVVAASVDGLRIAVRRRNIEEEDDVVDPCFFDADYSVAASTGSLMWEGSWACIELLRQSDSWLRVMLAGKRVIELGSGIGLLGLCAAAAGAHVLVTDVPAVVMTTLEANVHDATATAARSVNGQGSKTQWEEAWNGALSLGRGSVAVQALNWFLALAQQQTPNDPHTADVILAAECVWLQELIEPFVATVTALLMAPRPHTSRGEPRPQPMCVLAFRERGTEASQTFCTTSRVLDAFAAAGCAVVERGIGDAPESRGLLTSFYEIRMATATEGAAGASSKGGGTVRCTAISLARRPDRWAACEEHLVSVTPPGVPLDIFAGSDAKAAVGNAVGEARVAALETALACTVYRGWPITETEHVRHCFPQLAHATDAEAWMGYQRACNAAFRPDRARLYVDFFMRHVAVGEVGASISHLRVIERAHAEGTGVQIIFEDDARPTADAIPRLLEEVRTERV